ncbi:MAG: MBL fold metallo-hydrolase [Verrucomicrobiae bacterium]|nr:MBL fold metallo-hydrolase [Verrucomicrobiae bacterium]
MRIISALRLIAGFLLGLTLPAPAGSPTLQPVDPSRWPHLFRWTDTCNVYVLRAGDAALLIDLGDGSVLERLPDLGVRRVEWVLFTHHHREQCQGAPRLAATAAEFAAPAAERDIFEQPLKFRKLHVHLNDPFSVYGASYVRPPIQPIPLALTFETNDLFHWRGFDFRCVATPGNSPGSMTYLLRQGDHWLAFSGDLMLDGARLHTWHDSEWDYGYGAGIRALRDSAARLEALAPACLLPAHGPLIRDPLPQLRAFQYKLQRFEALYVRGYDMQRVATHQDKISRPTPIPHLGQISPHLFKFNLPNFWGNFGLILADSGRALVVDCGLLGEDRLDAALHGLRQHYGLKAIDAVIVTHMHGDHFLEAPHLRQRWGAQIWALDNMVDKMERPERYPYAAMLQAYGKSGPDGSPLRRVKVDRAFRPGETFSWEGFRFTVDWMPGQTEFALCLHGIIDGRKVAFTGDNLFGDPLNPAHTAHEAVVAFNSAILEEGYIYAGEYLKKLQPDLMLGGHSFVMDQPAALIERFRRWAYTLRDTYQELSAEKDYRYMFDPFWVRAEPYRLSLPAGGAAPLQLHVRNFLRAPQTHRIAICTPTGLAATPPVLTGRLPAQARRAFPIQLQAAAHLAPGVYLAAFDVTLDGRRYGQRFDVIVEVTPAR